MGKGHIMVFMTAPNAEEAARIGRKAVEEGLSACCNIIPGLRSIYRWKGEVSDEPEVLCLFKTRSELFDRLSGRLKELHSYETPEVISVNIEGALPAYLAWIDDSTLKTL
ncbi:MAG: divalent-cation tolerance protein CutA [Deltaproteobacteria bacterium]|nr:divalent-cation tolerance protein CutA [Deltaproteobacteria bacterium]